MPYTQRVSLHWTTSLLAVTRRAAAIAVGLCLLLVCGCTTIGLDVPAANAAVGLSGTLHGGKQPIAGATVQIYAVGTTGAGSPATPLLATPAKTNDLGAFTLGKYTCSSPTSQIYLAATGGNPGLAPNSTNPQSTEMVALGSCEDFNSSDTVEVNEITTVAATYALAPFMKSAIAVGSGPEDAQALATAFSSAASLANTANGTTPGIKVPADTVVPSEKVSTLANILSTCINSSGGMVGSSSPCGQLFSLTLSTNGKAPTDTTEALLDLANNPTQNVRAIFDLSPGIGPFQPGLAAAPADWRVEVTAAPPAPLFSPKPGSYSAATSVSLTSPEASAAIYYTTDGSQPSTSSTRYTGAFTVSLTTTIRAVAVAAGVSSVVASATYTLPAEKLVFRTQPTSGLAGAVISPSPSVAIENLAGAVNSAANGPITLQIGANPASATLSGTTTVNAIKGIATFPGLTIDIQGDGYSLIARASGVSAVTSNPFNRTNSVTLSLPATAPAAGTSGTASFTLKAPTPPGGLVATLQSSNESVATVKPTSIAIPAGATKGTFEYQGIGPGSATLTINVPGTPPASATAKIIPAVSVSLTPAIVKLYAAQTQRFAASVANSSNTAVTWTLSPAVGTISAAGLYTAPSTIPAAQTVTVTATSSADSTKTAAAIISLTPPVSVSLTPTSVTLGQSQTQSFAATVANSSNTAVTWTLSPAVGSISAAGLYTAPATISAVQTVMVKATSSADTTKTATATVSLTPPVSVSLTPASVTLGQSQTQSFTATVANNSNTAVTWSLSPAVGSISANGLYTAPSTIGAAQTVTVTATSVADSTKTATATVSLTPPVSISLTPTSVTLGQSQTQSFAASVANSSNTAVTWTLSPAVGTISTAGLYTAPATIPSAQTVTVKATSVADSTKTATATISLTPPVSISLTPGSVTLGQSQTQSFAAAVTNSSNTAVTWTLSPAAGTISTAGLYTAPATIATAQTVTVKATSVADSTKTATATVLLAPPVSISLTPGSVTLGQSQTQSFAAAVTNSSNTAVTWTLSPALGSISAAGLYTAPATISASQTVTVTATSVADSTKTATATISLVPPISVSLTPSTVTLGQSQTQSFAASVANSSNTAVTWSLSPAVGSISANGLYTAPATIAAAQTVTLKATSVADSTKAATATVSLIMPVNTYATYYLSPIGNDSNSGTSGNSPWLTPNHAINCGDIIIASPSSAYLAANFAGGKWGTVNCAAGNNVAWLQCAIFDSCKIHVTSGSLDGMRVSASYWGVEGWEVSNTAGGTGGGNCFTAVPANTTLSIHHIVFANDVATVCPLGGLGSGNNGTAGVDYFAVVGSIAYGAGQTNTWCGSGISVYEPVASDSLPGTHIYVGGNFSYGTTNPSGCYDGNGIIFDTFDGYQTPMQHTYTQQGVIDNNITLANGGVGVRIEYNNAGNGPTHSHIFARHNTMWGNSKGVYQYGNPSCGELQLYNTVTTEAYLNLAATNQTGCYGAPWNPAYAYSVSNIDNTSSVYQNVAWSATGSYINVLSSPSFLLSPNNVLGSNPLFANAVAPAAPSCGSAINAPNCMATVIANFTPTAAAGGYGYQTPSSAPIYDSLFPQWLCNVNLPAGLVTMGCLTQ